MTRLGQERSASAIGAAAAYFRLGVLLIIRAEWRQACHHTN
jgi:hypothetical protein